MIKQQAHGFCYHAKGCEVDAKPFFFTNESPGPSLADIMLQSCLLGSVTFVVWSANDDVPSLRTVFQFLGRQQRHIVTCSLAHPRLPGESVCIPCEKGKIAAQARREEFFSRKAFARDSHSTERL